ncbi:MAG: alkaline phosphatase family protein [Bryobacteraceae bacterium]
MRWILAALLALAAHAQNAVVVGYDGLGSVWLKEAKAPVIHGVRARGAWTYHARAVMPSSSSPNWASMIMGATPSQHGVTSNDWMPGTGPFFPTIFGVLRKQEPAADIAIFHEWEGFARLAEPGAANRVEQPGKRDADDTVRRALAYLAGHKPRLTFVHLDLIDHAGHKSGYGSPEYFAAIEKADALTGRILAAVPSGTLVLLCADHGGSGNKHGGATVTEIQIPWILAGPGVAKTELRTPVNIYDTAPTLAHALGVKPPAAWTGKVVLEAFGR